MGTAEAIVVMNRDIQDVDSNLADIGQRCNPRLVEKKSAHLGQIKSDVLDKGMGGHCFCSLGEFCLQLLTRVFMRRCRQTGVWSTALSASPLYCYDFETAQTTQFSPAERKAFCYFATFA